MVREARQHERDGTAKMDEKINNPVAKHARTFNKSNVMKDRKKATKKGYRKHRGKMDEFVSNAELDKLQRGADAKLGKHGIDLDIKGRHFTDRVNDKRNDPEIDANDINTLINKIDKKKGQQIKQKSGKQAVLRDKKSKLNVPVVVGNVKRDGSGKKTVDVKAKTIMRKRDFKSSTPVIAYEGQQHTNSAARVPQVVTGPDGKKRVRMVPAHRDVETENFVVTTDSKDGKSVVKKTYPTRQASRAHANKENEKNPGSHDYMHKKHVKKESVDLDEAPAQGVRNVFKKLRDPKVKRRMDLNKQKDRERQSAMGPGERKALKSKRKDAKLMRHRRSMDAAHQSHASSMEQWSPEMKENGKGLWANIRAKRARGEKPAKKGDKDYPDTLDIGEGMKQARKNVGADKCWDGYKAKGTKKKDGKDVPNCVKEGKKTFAEFNESAWQRKEGKNKAGGLNEKGRKSYERENPGSDLKAPQPEGGPRKKSFCARMGGMKGPMKDDKGKPTRKALALRKWKC